MTFAFLRARFRFESLLLLCCGLLQGIFSSSEVPFLVASCAACVVLAVLVVRLLSDVSSLVLSDLLAISLLLGYSLGSVFALYKNGWDVGALVVLAGVVVDYLNYAHALVLIVCAVLLVVGGGALRDYLNVDLGAVSVGFYDLLFCSLFVVISVLSLYFGVIGFQMEVSDDAGRMSVMGSMVLALMVPVGAYCVFVASKSAYRSMFLVLAVLTFALLVTQGRRAAIYCVVSYVIAAGLSGIDLKSISLKKMIVLLSSGLGLLVAFRLFFSFRMASWSSAGYGVSVVDLLPQAIDIFFNPSSYDLADKISENESFRTFILGYLALLFERVSDVGLMSGDVIIFNLKLSIPSVLYSGKAAVNALGADEEIIHPFMGLPVWDAANSILTSGLCDFGFVGSVIYSVFLCSAFDVLLRWVRLLCSWRVAFLSVIMVVFLLLNVESPLSNYMVVARTVLIVLAGGLFLGMFGFNKRIPRA